ncbi:hypothetical protein PRK78_006959 [Emydomyces testavorans]|uniref:Aminoglycoside phosphotransferase domain-containing protein n=1 Tax=Emydomyces testavorans TaxID=2070801 RepID=A0AAF0IPN8_9EURO|nr:hypothetical protein PRK78_006959 [Emydomyces testavorans]
MLPNKPNEDFRSSVFFESWTQLPSPKDVRAQARAQYLAGNSRDKRKYLGSGQGPHYHPPPATFESMGLFIKWGADVTIAEGQCLYAIHHCLKGNVPVPEIFGWRTDGREVFLYMELIHGQTLEEAWDFMDLKDHTRICMELCTSIANLRQLQQDPQDPFIGNIGQKHFYDRAIGIQYMPEAGPFCSVKEFHDWFVFLCRRPMADPYSIPIEPFRSDLPDDAAIKFTHGDLHRSNILVTKSEPRQLHSIVDWEQSGWFPEYWEYQKAHFTAGWEGEWATKYLPMILPQYESTIDAWSWYTSSIGV